MNRTLLHCFAIAGLGGLIPSGASAQIAGTPFNCTISQTRPVVTTQLRPQAVTTFCDVTETQVQQQQVVENVPITTTRNVTVDEGGYQMVWVPKPVTKQVAETTIQRQVKTVSVPVQVTRRVPTMTTQMVPVQSVQLVTEEVPVQTMAVAAPACNTCNTRRAFGPARMAPQMSYLPPVYPTVPYTTTMVAPYTTATISTVPVVVAPLPQTAYNPAALYPTPAVSDPAHSSSSSDYETVPARSVPVPKEEASAPVRKTSMFNGVPSAASVWQTRNTVTR